MQGCVTCIQQTVCYQSVFFVGMGVRYTHFPFSETSPSSPTLPCSSTVYPNDMCYVSPASSVTAVCSMPQYFKQELYFKQLTGFFFFYIPEQKGPLLEVTAIKEAFTTIQNTKPLHIYARQTITNCPTLYHLLQCWGLLQCQFPTRKRTGFARKV